MISNFLVNPAFSQSKWQLYEETQLKGTISGTVSTGDILQTMSGETYEIVEPYLDFVFEFYPDVMIFSDGSFYRLIVDGFSDPMICKKLNSSSSKPTKSVRSYGNEGEAYLSKIDEDLDDILKLTNGAVVEISYGYLGYVGYSKECALFKSGSQWKIWIEGKKTYKCDVLKMPAYGKAISARLSYISEVKGNGEIIKMSDGSIYEVDSYDSYHTRMWYGNTEVLILDSYNAVLGKNDSGLFEMLNLEEGDEKITVSKLK
jgi:hypothetical protein